MLNYNLFYPNLYTQRRGNMKINGVGTIKVEPNMAVVNLGIITENISLEVAQKENATKATEVLSNLQQMGIPENQIRTASYTIEPEYYYVEGKQIFKGYKVTNILSVTIKDLTKIGEVIDNVTSSGVNSIDRISFTVEDPSRYYNEALKVAVKNSVQKAMVLGRTLGVYVDPTPFKIIEESYVIAPLESSTMKFSTSTTPILPGKIDVTARLVALFNY
jgi:uncharacterized protein YggE